MIAVFSCKHGRDKVHDLFIENMRWLHKEFGIELYLATTYGETYKEKWIKSIKYQNNPLGAKWNAVVKMALDSHFDLFMGMGDDDLISPNAVQQILEAEEHHVGAKDLYFVNPSTQEAVYSKYKYKCDKLIGAGRTFSREAICNSAMFMRVTLLRTLKNGPTVYGPGSVISVNHAQASYLHCRGVATVMRNSDSFEFFESSVNSGLDHTSDMNLVMAGYLPHAIELEDLIVDVKSKENIWSFDRRKKAKEAEPASYHRALRWINKPMREKLNILENDR